MANCRDTLQRVGRYIPPTGNVYDPVATHFTLPDYLSIEADTNHEDGESRNEAELSQSIREVSYRRVKRQRFQNSDMGLPFAPVTESIHGRFKREVQLRRRNEKKGPVPPSNEKSSDPRSWVGQPVQQRAPKEVKKEPYGSGGCGDRVLTTHEFKSMEASSKLQPADPPAIAKRHTQTFRQGPMGSAMPQKHTRYQEIAHSSTSMLHPEQYGITRPQQQTMFDASWDLAFCQGPNASERSVGVTSEPNRVQQKQAAPQAAEPSADLEQARLLCQQKISMIKHERDGCKADISSLKAIKTLKSVEKTKLETLELRAHDLLDRMLSLEEILQKPHSKLLVDHLSLKEAHVVLKSENAEMSKKILNLDADAKAIKNQEDITQAWNRQRSNDIEAMLEKLREQSTQTKQIISNCLKLHPDEMPLNLPLVDVDTALPSRSTIDLKGEALLCEYRRKAGMNTQSTSRKRKAKCEPVSEDDDEEDGFFD